MVHPRHRERRRAEAPVVLERLARGDDAVRAAARAAPIEAGADGEQRDGRAEHGERDAEGHAEHRAAVRPREGAAPEHDEVAQEDLRVRVSAARGEEARAGRTFTTRSAVSAHMSTCTGSGLSVVVCAQGIPATTLLMHSFAAVTRACEMR